MTPPAKPMHDPLPCPFCGGEVHLILPRTCGKKTPYNPADRAFPIVRCTGCWAEMPGENWSEPSTAIAAWNRRAAPAVQALGQQEAGSEAQQENEPGGEVGTGVPASRIDAALSAPGCDRLRDFYAVGPVQRAAVQSFADALTYGAEGARQPWDAQPGCHACGRSPGGACTNPEGCEHPPAPRGVLEVPRINPACGVHGPIPCPGARCICTSGMAPTEGGKQ